jgi:hypothetical protein
MLNISLEGMIAVLFVSVAIGKGWSSYNESQVEIKRLELEILQSENNPCIEPAYYQWRRM